MQLASFFSEPGIPKKIKNKEFDFFLLDCVFLFLFFLFFSVSFWACSAPATGHFG